MRILTLLCLGIVILGVSCASNTGQDSQAKIEPLQGELAGLDSPLIQEGFELVPVIESKKSLVGGVYLLAKTGKIEIPIRTIDEFSQVVREITSDTDALAYVRLLTSQDIRPYLQDAYYAEVHKQSGEDDRWFAIAPEQYDAWSLHEPVVTLEDDVYTIERFVAAYPRYIEGKQATDAALLKIRERVTPTGKYLMEVRNILAEGDDIYKILVFTK